MGMILNVYRDASGVDCTNGGVSGILNTICVVNVEGPFQPGLSVRAFRLEERAGCGLVLYPEGSTPSDSVGPMFGGNYAGTSDSRFSEACEALIGFNPGVVRVFDRYESAEQYAANFD